MREKLNTEITKYSNFTLLSSVENTTPLVVKEALICGLGVVVSEQVSVELDASLDFIDVIPDYNSIAKHQINIFDVNSEVSNAMVGARVGTFYNGEFRIFSKSTDVRSFN